MPKSMDTGTLKQIFHISESSDRIIARMLAGNHESLVSIPDEWREEHEFLQLRLDVSCLRVCGYRLRQLEVELA